MVASRDGTFARDRVGVVRSMLGVAPQIRGRCEHSKCRQTGKMV
jgi:hypothetical protein